MAAPWTTLWEAISTHQGIVHDTEAVENVRRAFQVAKSLTFVIGKKQSDYGKNRGISIYRSLDTAVFLYRLLVQVIVYRDIF